ncbi:MAG: ABC transporter permease [Coriobacteriia bacterium]|nr:ABC transporter permease [Coriobacteriia bacterium]
MRRAFYIAMKDLRVWARDPSALGILIAMPAILIIILGSALGGLTSGGGGTQIKVAIVNLDTRILNHPRSDDQAAKLEDALTGADRIKALFAIERSRDLAGTRARVASGELAAALVIPKGFGAALGDGRAVDLQVFTDPGSGTAAGIWESVVKAVATRYSAVTVVVRTALEATQNSDSPALAQAGGAAEIAGLAITQAAKDNALDAVTVDDTVASGNVKVTSLDYYALSMTAMFLMFGAMYGAFSTIRERREQTMPRMLASPTPRTAVVGGKMMGVFALGLAQFVALYLFTRFVLHVQWGENPAATLLVACAEIAAVTGLATLIAAVARTERGVGGIGPVLVQIQALVGGAFFPVTVLPVWLQWIRYLSVVGWAIEGWHRVQVEGAGVTGVLGPVVALLAFAIAFYAFGVWRAGAER